MFSTLTNLVLLVAAKQYIIDVSVQEPTSTFISGSIRTRSEIHNKEYLSFLTNERDNIVDVVEIGNYKAVIVDYPEEDVYRLLDYPVVQSIEEDGTVSADDLSIYSPYHEPYNISPYDHRGNSVGYFNEIQMKAYFLQRNPIWNLDRIDQRENTLNQKYYFDTNVGRNVNVYVIDSGIDISHPQFQGRAKWGINTVDKVNTDCNKHGTHVAGSIGSSRYGVAKATNLVAVKVLDCNGGGSFSGVLKGIEFVVDSHKRSGLPSVSNMSLGGGKSQALNNAVKAMVESGVHTVLAAGNENQDACNTSPASEESAMTVGATSKTNGLAGFSNWGSCVDILAPGTEIISTVPGNKIETLQGTSMASPQVAGVYALILSKNPQLTPSVAKNLIKTTCTKNVISGVKGETPNCLLYSIF